ncbi:hypothetical protein [Microtetraspora fusca]|uniref:hypothetical protein n=1 Tax=Microtetraspora fusca TaxID=1997 RepID=UPI000831FC8B|nr:hypothetical protein [Microtetraspora fusca]
MNEHVQRPPAEIRYADELARLRENDTDDRPPGWALSLRAARRFVLGDEKLDISRQAAQPRYMWEHRRLWWPSRRRQRLMEEQGWERIVPSDFDSPWAYYERRLNEPAERA